MEVIDPGHVYRFSCLDVPLDALSNKEMLFFVKRMGKGYPGNKTAHAGTTLQEVFRGCLDRAVYLNSQQGHWTNWFLIRFIKLSIWMLEIRAALRHKRKIPGINESVYGAVCEGCLHVGCVGKHHQSQI